MNNHMNKVLVNKAINLSYESQVDLMHSTGRYLETSNVQGGIKDTINTDFSKFISGSVTNYENLNSAWIDFVINYK